MSTLVTAAIPAPLSAEAGSATLAELRSARRRNRVAKIDWMDAAYHAYVSAIIGVAVVLGVSSAVGDKVVSAATVTKSVDHGPALLSIGVALAVAIGLRSGSRGGPLALEAAEVRYVLLAPVDRRRALRSLALRQLRFLVFFGVIAGAVAGQLAYRRFHHPAVAWVGAGALFGLTTVLAAYGAGLVAGGTRLRRPVATLAGGALLAWAVADLSWGAWSPLRLVGSIALWPLEFHAVDLVAVVATVALVAGGLALLGGLSLEAAEARTGLVSQLRFAVTLQDLRTVMVLRRQLAQDRPRTNPWIRLRAGRRLPVWRRDWRGLLRFPAARLIRLALLGAAAGVALRGVWSGTTPLVVVAGLALYLAALDAVEPLAQEVDQSDRSDALPVDTCGLLTRHLAAPAVAMLAVAVVGAIVGTAMGFTARAAAVAALAIVPAAAGATAGAVVSVVQGAPKPFEDGQLLPPEVTGMKIALRTALPLVLATVGALPVLMAHRAVERHHSPITAAAVAAAVTLVPAALTAMWVRVRDDMRRWWSEQMQIAKSGGPAAAKGAGAR